MFILIRLTQHVSGIIMPIVRRTDCVKKLHVVYAWLCWLQSCRVWDMSSVHTVHTAVTVCLTYPTSVTTILVACRKHGSLSRNIQEELEAVLLFQ